MNKAKLRRGLLSWAAVPVALTVVLTGCASGSVGGGTKATPAASDSKYASIIPKGDIVAASKKLVSDSLTASTGFTPKNTGPKAQQGGATVAFVGSDLTNGGVNTVSQGVKEAPSRRV